MPKRGDIYIGASGNEALISPIGRKLSIGDNELGKKEQTASGRTVKDIIAVKKRIKLSYETIDEAVLNQLIDLYILHSELNIWIYTSTPPIGTEEDDFVDYREEYVVLMEPMDRERLLLGPNEDGLWTGVIAEFNEV